MEEYFKKILEEVLKRHQKDFLSKVTKLIESKGQKEKGVIIHDRDYFITKQKAAEILSVSAGLIDKWVRDGDLKKYYLNGRNVRFRKTDIQAMMKPKEDVSFSIPQPSRQLKRGRAYVKE